MRQLLVAGELWANEHKGLLPPDLNAIVTDIDYFTFTPEIMLCPVDRTAKAPNNWKTMSRKEQNAWLLEHTSYTYDGGRIDSLKAIAGGAGGEIIVLTERPRDHINRGGGMNIGFADGHTEFVTNAELPAVRARSDAARDKLLESSK